jgi:hypothetical protein
MTAATARCAFALAALVCPGMSAQAPPATAIVGATLVDGQGGPPIQDAVVVISGPRIVAAGSRATVAIPADIKNIRKVDAVFKDGRAVNRTRLPEARVLSVAPPVPKTSSGAAR